MKGLQVSYKLKMDRKRSWSNLRYYHGILLGNLRKTMKNVSQYRRYVDRDLNVTFRIRRRIANYLITTFGSRVVGTA